MRKEYRFFLDDDDGIDAELFSKIVRKEFIKSSNGTFSLESPYVTLGSKLKNGFTPQNFSTYRKFLRSIFPKTHEHYRYIEDVIKKITILMTEL